MLSEKHSETICIPNMQAKTMGSNFIAVISPAKLLDDSIKYSKLNSTQPTFLDEANELMVKLKKLKPKQIGELMELSEKLSQENFIRFQEWSMPFTKENAVPAMLLFKGDVYRGLAAHELTDNQLNWAQNHVRILSGLYGIVKPLDLIQSYRLMMGTPFAYSKSINNLYKFWGTKLSEELNKEVGPKGVIVNLASQEYFKAAATPKLERPVIHCEFKEKKGSSYTIISTYAKLARGRMTRFIIDQKVTKAEDLKAFDYDNYLFNKSLSSDNHYVFSRG